MSATGDFVAYLIAFVCFVAEALMVAFEVAHPRLALIACGLAAFTFVFLMHAMDAI